MPRWLHFGLVVAFLCGCQVAATDDVVTGTIGAFNLGAWAFNLFAWRRELFGRAR